MPTLAYTMMAVALGGALAQLLELASHVAIIPGGKPRKTCGGPWPLLNHQPLGLRIGHPVEKKRRGNIDVHFARFIQDRVNIQVG